MTTNKPMRAVYEAAKAIAEHFDLEPGSTITITVNAVGNPEVEYSRALTKKLIDKENNKDNPWRVWVGPPEDKH